MNKNRIALITGASSGIGEATARLLAKNNFSLILCGRREDKLQLLKHELAAFTSVITVSFDVRSKEDVKKQLNSLTEEWKEVDVLVNNAGNAHGLDPVQSANIDDWDSMIDINVKGLLYVSREILPAMVNKKKGHIINLGSIAAKQVYANGSVYCASKAAVDSITEGMRIDLNPYGIKVTSIHPGMVETEFSLVRFKGDKERADSVYKGLTPLSANDIADVILYTLNCPPHVVIADLVVLPLAQASATVVKRS
jgi:3-hydroxy acid dehydrogenase/malonic semialdehyde reductase